MRIFSVGRSENADMTIPDPSVSRRHLSVEVINVDNIILRDLGSTNGSFIIRNGNKVRFQQETASMHDQLVLGEAYILVADLIEMYVPQERPAAADRPAPSAPSAPSAPGVSIYVRGADGSFGRKK